MLTSEFFPNSSHSKESLAELWSGFLEQEAPAGHGEVENTQRGKFFEAWLIFPLRCICPGVWLCVVLPMAHLGAIAFR